MDNISGNSGRNFSFNNPYNRFNNNGRANLGQQAAPAGIFSDSEEDPDDIKIEYVCSKGDREVHSVKDSFQAVTAHEERHIQDYRQIAQKLGLKVVNPQIKVFSGFNDKAKKQAAKGGEATCKFSAEINGREIFVPVSKSGDISDVSIAKALQQEKQRGLSGIRI